MGIAGRARAELPEAEVEMLRRLALYSDADAYLLRTAIPRLLPLTDDMLEVLLGLWAALAPDREEAGDQAPALDALVGLQAVFRDWLWMLGRQPAGSGWLLPPDLLQHAVTDLRSTAVVVAAISPLIQAVGPFLAQVALDADELSRLQGAWRRAMVLQAALWVRELSGALPKDTGASG
jgi:hypothetical protein